MSRSYSVKAFKWNVSNLDDLNMKISSFIIEKNWHNCKKSHWIVQCIYKQLIVYYIFNKDEKNNAKTLKKKKIQFTVASKGIKYSEKCLTEEIKDIF